MYFAAARISAVGSVLAELEVDRLCVPAAEAADQRHDEQAPRRLWVGIGDDSGEGRAHVLTVLVTSGTNDPRKGERARPRGPSRNLLTRESYARGWIAPTASVEYSNSAFSP